MTHLPNSNSISFEPTMQKISGNDNTSDQHSYIIPISASLSFSNTSIPGMQNESGIE